MYGKFQHTGAGPIQCTALYVSKFQHTVAGPISVYGKFQHTGAGPISVYSMICQNISAHRTWSYISVWQYMSAYFSTQEQVLFSVQHYMSAYFSTQQQVLFSVQHYISAYFNTQEQVLLQLTAFKVSMFQDSRASPISGYSFKSQHISALSSRSLFSL